MQLSIAVAVVAASMVAVANVAVVVVCPEYANKVGFAI
jgi:hypothetical protein